MAIRLDFPPHKCKRLSVLLVAGCLVGLVIINIKSDPREAQAQPLVVLVWHWPFQSAADLDGDVCWDTYRIPDCVVTRNRSLYGAADVLVIHHPDTRGEVSNLPPGPRPGHQMWLWLNLESPSNSPAVRRFNGLFNWTMTYKTDSDIFVPYGELVRNREREPPLSIPDKPKLATWVVSNYRGHSNRAEYHASLSKFMRIDVRGRANNSPISRESLLPTISDYAFYLAFENSVHRDYITEKLWRNSFLAGAVPVVLGPPRANYERFVPPDSFIHVEDFASPSQLASFLGGLWRDPSHYAQYFNWRQKYSVKMCTDWQERFCNICNKFHSLPQTRIYHNLSDWFKAE